MNQLGMGLASLSLVAEETTRKESIPSTLAYLGTTPNEVGKTPFDCKIFLPIWQATCQDGMLNESG